MKTKGGIMPEVPSYVPKEVKDPTLENLGRQALDTTKERIQNFGGAVKERGREAWEGLKERWGGFKNRVGSIREKATGFLGRLGNFAGSLGLRMVGATLTPEGRGMVSESVRNTAQATTERIKTGAEAVWDTTKEKVVGAKDLMVEKVKNGALRAQEAGVAVLKKIRNAELQRQMTELLKEGLMLPTQEDQQNKEESAVLAIREKFAKQRERIKARRDALESRAELLRKVMAA
jgi:hypothetical protein